MVLPILKSHSLVPDHLEFFWFCKPAQKSENPRSTIYDPTKIDKYLLTKNKDISSEKLVILPTSHGIGLGVPTLQ